MTTNFVHISGKKIAYYKYRPYDVLLNCPIVFLHDSLGCISVWKNFPKKIADALKAEIIVFDREGYGQSQAFEITQRTNLYLEEQADFLNLFLNEIGISKSYLFGHSDGGSIALIAAAKYPDKVEAIITEGAHVFVEEITLNGIKNAHAIYLNSDLKEKLKRHHGDKVEDVVNSWVNTWLSSEFLKWNIENILPKIKCPVCVLQGVDDEYGSDKQVDAIYHQVSGYKERYVIQNAAHSPHKENENETIKLVEQFFKSINHSETNK